MGIFDEWVGNESWFELVGRWWLGSKLVWILGRAEFDVGVGVQGLWICPPYESVACLSTTARQTEADSCALSLRRDIQLPKGRRAQTLDVTSLYPLSVIHCDVLSSLLELLDPLMSQIRVLLPPLWAHQCHPSPAAHSVPTHPPTTNTTSSSSLEPFPYPRQCGSVVMPLGHNYPAFLVSGDRGVWKIPFRFFFLCEVSQTEPGRGSLTAQSGSS